MAWECARRPSFLFPLGVAGVLVSIASVMLGSLVGAFMGRRWLVDLFEPTWWSRLRVASMAFPIIYVGGMHMVLSRLGAHIAVVTSAKAMGPAVLAC